MNRRWVISKLFALDHCVNGIVIGDEQFIYYTAGHEGLWKLNTNDGTCRCIATQKGVHMHSLTRRNSMLFICDMKGNQILRYDLGTQELSVFPLSKTFKISNIGGIVADKKFIYVANGKTVTLISLSSSGLHKSLKTLGNSDGIAITEDGKIFASQTDSHCLQLASEGQGKIVTGHKSKNAKNEFLYFNKPRGITVDKDGHILISHLNGISRYNMESKFCEQLYETKSAACCVAVDHKGKIYAGTVAGHLIVLQQAWDYTRYIWIGHLKENAKYCCLARLPKELIKEICCLVVK